MQISMSNKAHECISAIFEHTSNISNKYANQTIANIYSVINSLKDAPYIGRYVHELPDKHYRERIYKKFRIIYYISETNNTIYIRYIFSVRQNLKNFLDLHQNDLIQFLSQDFI